MTARRPSRARPPDDAAPASPSPAATGEPAAGGRGAAGGGGSAGAADDAGALAASGAGELGAEAPAAAGAATHAPPGAAAPANGHAAGRGPASGWAANAGASSGEPLPPLDELLARHLPALKGFIRSRMDGLLAAKESSSDLVQSVCREVIEHIGRFEHRSEDGFRQWLYRTAERKTIDRLRYYTAAKRNAGREAELIEDGSGADVRRLFPSPSREAMAREELARAQAAFEALPQDYQTVIVLFRVQGLSHAEIAQRMGRSEGAVRNLLYRGLAAITDALGGGG